MAIAATEVSRPQTPMASLTQASLLNHAMQKYYGLPHTSIPCHTYQSITTPHQPPALAYHLIEYPSPKHPDISVNTASIPDWNKDTAPYRFNLTS